MTSAEVIAGRARWHIECADNFDVLRAMPDHCIDAVVTDPPAGISFMGMAFDSDKGGRDKWIAWLASVFLELRRVCKPGAHALVWALPRTSHWTATAIENAGWTIRDVGVHLFASGFPKSLDISKAIDRAASAAWTGWGTGLKPAGEHWILARAPLSEKTIAANVLKHGTGAIHIDACRIGYASESDAAAAAATAADRYRAQNDNRALFPFKNGEASLQPFLDKQSLGRWPAHVTLEHTERCRLEVEVAEVSCPPECPVRILDEQSGERPGMSGGGVHRDGYEGGMFGGIDSAATARADNGGASRFFYTAKPSTPEREKGCEHFASGSLGRGNAHPTVKPVSLMRWLCRMITPPNGVLVDPFAGSGTTLVAALAENFRAIGIEQDARFVEIARARIVGDAPLLNREGVA